MQASTLAPPILEKDQALASRQRLWADVRLFGITYVGALFFSLLFFA